jgi:hypothetical protein
MHLTSNNKMKNKKRTKRQSRTKLYFLFCFIEWIFWGVQKKYCVFFCLCKKSLPDFDKLLVKLLDLLLQSCFVCLFIAISLGNSSGEKALQHGSPQTFFQGRAKIFQGGGQEHTFCLKNKEKDTIFPTKVWKHTIFGRPWPARGGARAPLCPPLRTPMPYKAMKQCFSTCWPLQTFDWLRVILLC